MGPSPHWAATTRGVICGLWVYLRFFILRERGFCPGHQGTLMAVPDSSPRASAGVSVREPQRLTLADGTFFPPGCCAVPWGRASAPAGVAPEALQERGCSCKVLSQRLPVCEVSVSAGIGNVSGLGGAVCTYQHSSTFGAYPGGVAVRRAPEPGPVGGDRGELSDLFVRPFAVLPQDRGVRCPRLPSSGLRIADPSLSY
jgi:hypothetical protein